MDCKARFCRCDKGRIFGFEQCKRNFPGRVGVLLAIFVVFICCQQTWLTAAGTDQSKPQPTPKVVTVVYNFNFLFAPTKRDKPEPLWMFDRPHPAAQPASQLEKDAERKAVAMKKLKQLVVQTVNPGTWMAEGGDVGRIVIQEDNLIITHTEKNQRQAKNLFRALRKAGEINQFRATAKIVKIPIKEHRKLVAWQKQQAFAGWPAGYSVALLTDGQVQKFLGYVKTIPQGRCSTLPAVVIGHNGSVNCKLGSIKMLQLPLLGESQKTEKVWLNAGDTIWLQGSVSEGQPVKLRYKAGVCSVKSTSPACSYTVARGEGRVTLHSGEWYLVRLWPRGYVAAGIKKDSKSEGRAKCDVWSNPCNRLSAEVVYLLIKGEPLVKKGSSKLEFRVAPIKAKLKKRIVKDCLYELRYGNLISVPCALPENGVELHGHIWLPVTKQLSNMSQLVTGTYEGQKYVLASDKPAKSMLRGDNKPPWGFKSVSVAKGQGGYYRIDFELDSRGAELFSKLTKANVGQALAIVVDGEVVSAPVLMTALSNRGQITGAFSHVEAQSLANRLRQGMKTDR